MRFPPVVRLLITLFLLLAGAEINELVAQPTSQVLEPGVTLQGELKNKEIHYLLKIGESEFLNVEIKSSLGLPVILKLVSNGGQSVTKLDVRRSPFQTARFFFIPEAGGEYRLEFVQDKPGSGSYEIRMAPLRIATERDRNLYACQQLYADAAPEVNGNAELKRGITKVADCLAFGKDSIDLRSEAEMLYLKGFLHSQVEELSLAFDSFTRTLPLVRQLGDPLAEAAVTSALSNTSMGLGEPEKAEQYAEEALRLQRELQDHNGEALTLHNTSAIYRMTGEWQRALAYQRRALELWRGGGSSEAFALLGMGHLHRGLGDPESAIDYYLQALAIWEGLNSDFRFLRSIAEIKIGETYLYLGEWPKALERINRSLNLARAVDAGQIEATALMFRGLAFQKSGELQKALDTFNLALTKIGVTERHDMRAAVLHYLGESYLSLGELGKAEANLKEALSIRRYFNHYEDQAATLSALAQVERAKGQLSSSLVTVESALKIIESLRTKIVGPEQRATFFAQSQDSYKLYIDILMQLHKREPDAGHAAKALMASEHARARSLLETLNESPTQLREGIETALLTRERTLQQRLNAKAARLTLLLGSTQTGEQADAVRKEVEATLTELQIVQDEIRIRSPRYAALTQPKKLTLPEIQTSLLDPDTLLLEYSLGEERSYVWAITQHTADAYELPGRARIETAARNLYEALTTRNKKRKGESTEQRLSAIRAADKQSATAARTLSDLVLTPVQKHLGAKRVVVVAEGALQYVPFAVLPTPNLRVGTVEMLVERQEIVTLPSISTLAVLRQEVRQRQPATKLLAIIADPVFERDDPRLKQNLAKATKVNALVSLQAQSTRLNEVERSARDVGVEKLERLYFSSREADTIASLAPEDQILKVVGFSANKENATRSDLGSYRFIHFATHGFINTRHSELSGIVLSLVDERGQPIDGFLRLHEIYNLRLSADLVVLSACQSALGKEIKGEGFIGLSRGFMYAGAPRIVASLWRVDDRATAELMALFYKAMIERSLTPAAALQHAQKEMSKKWASPYFWAGFTLQGEWR